MKCLRKVGAMDSNLIRIPPAAGVRTLLCNVDIKIMLLRIVHVSDVTRLNINEGGSGLHTTNALATERSRP